MKFDAGDRVYYVSERHSIHQANPLKGSEYECIGTITNINILSVNTISVSWDNGHGNIYSEIDLELAEESLCNTDPNKLFKRK